MLKRMAVLLGLCSPLLLHLALLADRPALAAACTLLLALLALWSRVAPALRLPLLGLTVLICVGTALNDSAALGMVYIAPVAIYVAVGVVFGRTLLAGREPLVARIARLDRGGALPEDMVGYVRGVTWAWALLMVCLTVVSIALALYGTPQAWSWFNNVWALILIAVLFAGEYCFRLLRFRHHAHNSPLRVAYLMARNAPELLR